MKHLVILATLIIFALPAIAAAEWVYNPMIGKWVHQPDDTPDVISPLMENRQRNQEAMRGIADQVQDMVQRRRMKEYIRAGDFSRQGLKRFVRNHPNITREEIIGLAEIARYMGEW